LVISKWLLPELSSSDRSSRGTKTLGTRLAKLRKRALLRTHHIKCKAKQGVGKIANHAQYSWFETEK